MYGIHYCMIHASNQRKSVHYNILNSQLLISQGGGACYFFAADYGGAVMEPIPVINGIHSRNGGEVCPVMICLADTTIGLLRFPLTITH